MLTPIVCATVFSLQQFAIPITHIATVGRTGVSGRRSLPIDRVQQFLLNDPLFKLQEGQSLKMADGTDRAVVGVDVGSDGTFRHQNLQGGWAYAEIDSPENRIMFLEASGHSMVYVNGVPRAGDPYSYGWLKTPVELVRGKNSFLFAAGRGSLKASLTAVAKPISLNMADPTLPDFVLGNRKPQLGAVVVTNATKEFTKGLEIVAEVDGVSRKTKCDPIPPLGFRKIGFELIAPNLKKEGVVKCTITLVRDGKAVDSAKFDLRVRNSLQTKKITFRSEIDGSVQYFGVVPCSDLSNRNGAIVLSCHGASVEAIGQADAYSSKPWATIVAPTNRRPFGFDWEDWGRMDAMEVLALAKTMFPHDERRIYLTGHSMGGHGTYTLGALFPGEFAAIAPSAGWASFDSYTGSRFGENPSQAQMMMDRACGPSRTETLVQNYSDLGVYILHGDADDNVPVTEARKMKSLLEPFHKDFRLFEQPGAGHWWENSDEPGAECVDWAPMFDFFSRRQRPAIEEVRRVTFATYSPCISAAKDWVTIVSQTKPLILSKVEVSLDPHQRRFTGTTENVERLQLFVGGLKGTGDISVKLDSSTLKVLPPPGENKILLEHKQDVWIAVSEFPASNKNPGRSGLFKQAFSNRFALVYGTHGTAEENLQSFCKARFDAETFYYRGNGSVDIFSDDEFLATQAKSGRNAIFYGNERINTGWKSEIADFPIRLGSAPFRFGETQLTAGAAMFVRPSSSSNALFGFVGGSNLEMMRACDRIPYFVSGTAYPDATVFDEKVWSLGADSISVVGFFGNDWSIETGDWYHRQ